MKLKACLLLTLLTLSLAATSNLAFVSAENNCWAAKTSMPTARAGLGVAAVDGKIYAIGGWNPCPINNTEEYDPATDAWRTKQSMPTARMFFGTAVYEDKIYVVGGKIGQKATNATEVYDPKTDTWTTKAPMPMACYDVSACFVEGKIYVIGGIKPLSGTNITCINATQIYDPQTDTWTLGSPIPTPVYSYASAAVGTKIYVISGCTLKPDDVVDYNQVYDTQTGTWTTQACIPNAVNAPACICITSEGTPKIFVLGGSGTDFKTTYNLTQIYDVNGNTWSTGTSQPSCCFTSGTAELDKTLYVIGGAENLTAKNTVYALALSGTSIFPYNLVAFFVFAFIITAAVLLLVQRQFSNFPKP
jgi:N-acetylneuraminic acid mutarotase